MREEEKLQDVTLVREDQGGCGAHRVILIMSKHKHKHTWSPYPPGDRKWHVPLEELEWEEEQMAFTSYLNSPEGKKDMLVGKECEWPEVAEWCNTCPETRQIIYRIKGETEKKEEPVEKTKMREDCEEVKKEEKVPLLKEEREDVDRVGGEEEVEVEEGTELVTTSPKRRRGGRGSRMRRLLAHQLLLTEKRGFPLSRLLTTIKRANTRCKGRENRSMVEESASPVLRRVRVGGEEVRGEVRGGTGREELRRLGREGMVGETEDLAHNNLNKPVQLVPTVESTSPLTTPTKASSTTLTPTPACTLTTTQATLPSPQMWSTPISSPTPNFTHHYQLPYNTPFTPHFTTNFPPPQPPQCGPMPGPQWMLCQTCGCHSWGTFFPLFT